MNTSLRKPFIIGVCVLPSMLLASRLVALDPSKTVKATTLLRTTKSWNGQPLAYPQGQAQATVMKIEIAPGAQTGWHLHPVPSFAVVTQGKLDVHLKDGRVNHLKAGDTLAEVVNTLHNGENVGKVPVKLIVFYSGAIGNKLTVKEAALSNSKQQADSTPQGAR